MRTNTISVILIVSCVSMLMLLAASYAQEEKHITITAGDSMGNLYALDAPTGLLLWSNAVGGDTRSVVVADNGQSVLSGTSSSVALFSKDGNMLWNKTLWLALFVTTFTLYAVCLILL